MTEQSSCTDGVNKKHLVLRAANQNSQFIRLAYWAFQLNVDTVSSSDMVVIYCPLFEKRIWLLTSSYTLQQSWLQGFDFFDCFANREPQLVMQGLSQRASLCNGSIPMDVKFYCQWIFFSELKTKTKLHHLSTLSPGSFSPAFILSLSVLSLMALTISHKHAVNNQKDDNIWD